MEGVRRGGSLSVEPLEKEKLICQKILWGK